MGILDHIKQSLSALSAFAGVKKKGAKPRKKSIAKNHEKAAKPKANLKKRKIKISTAPRPSKSKKTKIIKKPKKTTGRHPGKSQEKRIGHVTHYFPNARAAALILETGVLKMGDEIHIKGQTTDFKQKITSMQIDRQPLLMAKEAQEIGIGVKQRTRANDVVYLNSV